MSAWTTWAERHQHQRKHSTHTSCRSQQWVKIFFYLFAIFDDFRYTWNVNPKFTRSILLLSVTVLLLIFASSHLNQYINRYQHTRLCLAAILWYWPTTRQTEWVRQWTWGQCTQTDDLDVNEASCSSCRPRWLYVNTPPGRPPTHSRLGCLLWLHPATLHAVPILPRIPIVGYWGLE